MIPGTDLPTNPFPGMNPYVEGFGLWPSFHNTVVTYLSVALGRQLRPEYRVTLEERVQVLLEPDGNDNGSGSGNGNGSGARSGNGLRVPDVAVLTGVGAGVSVGIGAGVEVAAVAGSDGGLRFPAPELSEDAIAVQLPTPELFKERYLEVRRVSNREVVAVIELLSPSNKDGGSGHKAYLDKRAAVLSSLAHLVEIDLLRAGPPMPFVGNVPDTHYRILVAHARRTDNIAALYPFGIRDAIPDFVLPLAQDAEGIAVNLNAVVGQVYADGSYDLDIDYAQNPEPPLSDDDRVWIDELLREQGLRETATAAVQEG